MASAQRPQKFGLDGSLRDLVRERLKGVPAEVDHVGLRRAAVAVALVADETGDAGLVLCRRGGVGSHPHQWGLPGGSVDPGETADEAAVRELREEVGLEAVEVLGRLDDYVTRSGYHLSPYVVWCPDQHPRIASPVEIASVHHVPLSELMRDDSPQWIRIAQSDRPVIQVLIGAHRIHAPTAAVIHQFAEWVLEGRPTSVADVEEPVFAWQ